MNLWITELYRGLNKCIVRTCYTVFSLQFRTYEPDFTHSWSFTICEFIMCDPDIIFIFLICFIRRGKLVLKMVSNLGGWINFETKFLEPTRKKGHAKIKKEEKVPLKVKNQVVRGFET